jgi:hypothetical protein
MCRNPCKNFIASQPGQNGRQIWRGEPSAYGRPQGRANLPDGQTVLRTEGIEKVLQGLNSPIILCV